MSNGLWLCIELPQLALEALAQDPTSTRVVYAQHGARRWVIASHHPGIQPGEALGSVQARFPDVRALARNASAEAAALQAIGCLAYGLSDRIVLASEPPRGIHDRPFHAVLVDIAPSLRLFGGIDALLAHARQRLETLPYSSRLGIAPTVEAAAVASRMGLGPMTDGESLRASLDDLPLEALRWPLPVQELLTGSGHRCLRDVLRHDTASLAARLGPEFPLALARLLGNMPDPRPWFTPPPRYRRRFDLDAEIDDWQVLLFPLRRLMSEFEAYLRARQVAVTQLDIILSRKRSEIETFTLRTTSPIQDASVFLRLLREHWNTRPPTAPAQELRLRADHFAGLPSGQGQLFDDGHAVGEAWNALTDRLRARLGDDALWRPGLAADHRPERAWSRDGVPRSDAPLPPRPLWLLRQPQPWKPRSPVSGRPERISSGWWDSAPINRDYYRAPGRDGEDLWVYQDRNSGNWYVHGLQG